MIFRAFFSPIMSDGLNPESTSTLQSNMTPWSFLNSTVRKKEEKLIKNQVPDPTFLRHI